MGKKALKLFLEDFFDTLFSLAKIVIGSRLFFRFRNKKYSGNECVILGNGPSLKDSLHKHHDFLSKRELICVNYFPTTEYYKVLKPSFFVTTAPELWDKLANEKYRLMGRKIFSAIADKTDWEVKLFIPFSASKSKEWKDIVKKNPSVDISYFNTTPVAGFKWFRHFMFRRNLGMPRPHNVLIPSIMLALSLGFKKIFILGADHSWLNEICVDHNNNVLVNQKHFYDENKTTARPMHKAGRGKRKLHEVLLKFYYAFKGYHTINEYALSRKVKIYNATEESFVDAFERIQL